MKSKPGESGNFRAKSMTSMDAIYLDTHVLAWLYDSRFDYFPKSAKEAMETSQLLVSPIVLLELQYLHEIGRLKVAAPVIVEYLEAAVSLRVCSLPFHLVVATSLDMAWTRDPFDRLVAAHALAGKCPLLTKDRTIHSQVDFAIWD